MPMVSALFRWRPDGRDDAARLDDS